MKIQILSDQHIEFKKNFSYVINRMIPRADVLVIAGDFCPHNELMRSKFIRAHILPKWKHTIIIPGNHEFWKSTCDDEWFGNRKEIYEQDGNICYYVNNDIVIIDEIPFVCSTMWSYIGHINSYYIQQSMGDYHNCKGLTVDITNKFHTDSRLFLNVAMKDLSNKRSVIVTHHIPSFNLISPRWRNEDLNEAFAADMDSFIMDNEGKISHWIHGHSHDCLDQYLCGIRFIRNPMGYPHERKGDMDLVITI